MSRELLQPSSIQEDIDRLALPGSLERIGRSIRVAGHRVALVQVLDKLFEGTSTERIKEMFPTIPACKLDEVFAFCDQNLELMRRYHEEQRAAYVGGQTARSGEAPTLAELRRRKEQRTGPVTPDG
jgi:uncharacterized protein (DUF433 family)